MNILFIVPYTPDRVRVRPYNLIRCLTGLRHHVYVATVWTNNADLQALKHLETECHMVISEKASRLQSLFYCLSTLPSSKPLQAAYSWQPKLASQLKLLLNRNNYDFDIIHVEHLRGSRYGLLIKSIINSNNRKIPIVWDSVDCISLLFRQASKKSRNMASRLITHLETGRTYQYEKWLIDQFDRILVTSGLDKNALMSMRNLGDNQPEISVLPNGVDLEYFHPANSGEREPATLLVSGKMSYHANVAMTLHLINDILPIVWSQNPTVKLWIVGKDPPNSIKKLAQEQKILVTGTVDDMRPYLQKATMAVAPVTYGAGIQNKVLEAMACSTPVISSSQAVSALSIVPGRDALLADDPEQFARTILELLDNPVRQREVGQAGRRYVEQNHSWSNITLKLEQAYQQLFPSQVVIN